MTSKWLKAAAAAMALVMSLTFAGCNGESASSEAEESSESGDVEETVKRKVGFIFNKSADNEGFAGQINDQRLKAARRCDIETEYIENVSVQDFEGAVKALISDGCTDIVSSSNIYANTLDAVSGRYMNVNFVNFGSYGGKANVCCYTETAYQGAYIAGMAAAYNSTTRRIGVVADTSLLYPYAVINAAALGAQLVSPSAVVVAASASRASEIRKAVNELKNDGCDVIISYTELPTTAEYCEQIGMKFIGNLDYSGVEEDYPHMLMYFYSNRDSFFLAQFKQMKLDSWASGAYVGSMANGIINVSQAQKCAQNGTQKIVDKLTPLITSGAPVFEGELKDTSGTIRYMNGEVLTSSEIYNMSWYVLGVEVLGNYREPELDLKPNDFVIKK